MQEGKTLSMSEREKVELYERTLAAWNRGDLDGVLAECTPDWEWDLTNSDIPGECRPHRGHEEYRSFAQRWREALGPTQLQLEGFRELEDGRLFAQIRQIGTGARSGVDVELSYFQITSFESSKAKRTEVFTDPDKAHAAAGSEPDLRSPDPRVDGT
jgi:ketosteroid isomerase-like protein